MARRINLLGALVIENNGRSSPLTKNAKGCALLAYLVVTGEQQSREFIADLLWESVSTYQSLRNLRVLLTRIRHWLPELKITRKTLALQPHPDLTLDLITLTEALKSEDIAVLDKSLRLYKGDLLTGFRLGDSPRFNEWLLFSRERLRQQVMSAFDHVCEGYTSKQQWSKGIDVAQRWLALDDLDEKAYRWLMLGLAGKGKISQALQQYDTCRQRLWQELGVDPEPATSTLARKIAQNESDGDSIWNTIQIQPLPKSGVLAEPGPLPPNSLVPHHRNFDFVGREALLLGLSEFVLPLSDADHIVNTAAVISGMGGIGKTQLAVEFCYRYGRYFPGGVFWLSFAEPDSIAEEIAATGGERGLGLFRDSDHLSLDEQVARVQKSWQKPLPRLLIFDNCESPTLLKHWLPVSVGCRVLITSRRSLWPRELDLTSFDLAPLSVEESVTLMRRLHPDLSEDAAAEIAAEVGYLPLALHLAGSFLHRYRQISPESYLNQLRNRGLLRHPSLQGQGISHSPTSHELHVARTFSANLDSLSPDDAAGKIVRKLLAQAACFAPSEPIPRLLFLRIASFAPEDDLEALLMVEDGLIQLVELGFLTISSSETIVIHRLLTAYAQEILPELNSVQDSLETQLSTLLSEQMQQQDSLAILPCSVSHLRHITDAAMQKGTLSAARLSGYLACHLREIGSFNRSRHYFDQAFRLLNEILGAEHPELAGFREQIGYLEVRLGNYPAAQQQYEQALTIRQQTFGLEHPETAESLHDMGTLSWRQGDYKTARQYLEQALAIREKTLPPNHIDIGSNFNVLGLVHLRTGSYDQAQYFLERSLEIRRNILGSDHHLIGQSYNNLGSVYLNKGDYKKSLSWYEKALENRLESLGESHPSSATGFTHLGNLHMLIGNFELAQSNLERALALKKKLLAPNHLSTATTLFRIGQLYLMMGQYEQAKHNLDAALTIRLEKIGRDSARTAALLDALGVLHMEKGDLTTASDYLHQALAIYRRVIGKENPDTANTKRNIGNLLARQGNAASAQSFFEEVLSVQEQLLGPDHPQTALTLIALGALHDQSSQFDRTRDFFERAVQILDQVVLPSHPELQQAKKRLTSVTDTKLHAD